MNSGTTIPDPTNGTDPTANPIYSGPGEQVVMNGNTNTIVVSGLSSGTNYCFRV